MYDDPAAKKSLSTNWLVPMVRVVENPSLHLMVIRQPYGTVGSLQILVVLKEVHLINFS